jgi:uncharacterized protein GlcG (DUF336 family)
MFNARSERNREPGRNRQPASRSISQSKVLFETMEPRQLMSVAVGTDASAVVPLGTTVRPLLTTASTKAAPKASKARIAQEGNLTAAQVTQILAQAASQARPGQAIAVVDREGVVLGVFRMNGATDATEQAAIARARTAAYFQSVGEAFTTRTARFIIQDHFPFPIQNTAGGPLYGVEFSSLPGSDMLPNDGIPYVSGDPGGVPLYLGRVPVGGIGVAGDGKDVAARFDLASPGQKVYNGREESDFDESVAMAGALGARTPANVRLNAYAPASIRATTVFLPGPALRFPFTNSNTANKNPFQPLASIDGAVSPNFPIKASQPNPYPKVDASVYGLPGELKNTSTLNTGLNKPNGGYGVVGSDDNAAVKLTVDDVNTIIRQAVLTSKNVRGAIRQPIGTAAVVHVAVVDRDGTVLGVFREEDGTNFSFDVAVQKARTAAFFSDDFHAFSCRAIGFMSQLYWPAGINSNGTSPGPLFHLQNALSAIPGNLGHGPLANGITIFPGGVPLYKDGQLVGAIGISGDGVEQDDQIAYGGAKGYQPAASIRCDNLSPGSIKTFILNKVAEMGTLYNLTSSNPQLSPTGGDTFTQQAQNSFDRKFDFRLPYVKFARNPLIRD